MLEALIKHQQSIMLLLKKMTDDSHLLLTDDDITMQAIKQEALNTISRMPEDTDMEEIIYRLYVLENIRKGQEDAAQGKTQTTEEVLRDIQTW